LKDEQPPAERHRRLKQILIVVVIVLLVPLVPFLILGAAFESRLIELMESYSSAESIAGLVVALLSLDILLPVPSSGVITFAGKQLGAFPAGIWSTVGLTCGCAFGYETAALVGDRLLKQSSNASDQALVSQFFNRWGRVTLIITRPLPLLGETAVLMAGYGRQPRHHFYPVIIVTNLIIAAAYASLGAWFAEDSAFAAVLIASLLVPLAATLLLRKLLRNRRDVCE